MQDTFDYLQLIGEAIPVAIVAMDDARRIRFINKVAEQFLPLSATTAIGQPADFLLARGPAEVREIVESTLTTRQSHTVQTIYLTPGGSPAVALVDTAPLSDKETGGGVLITVRPTAVQNTAPSLSRLETLSVIGEIAAGTIHEIRNPLTAISGFIQLLQLRATKHADQTAATYCTLISEEITHINNILSDFLALAKPQEMIFSKVDLLTLTRNVLALMYGEALLSGIRISESLPPGSWYVCGNGEKIKEVLINIIRNAFQAMNPSGVLTVTGEAETDQVAIRLTDTGPGIPAVIIDDIFKPFFTTKPSGTGLGLAICQQIMHDHGGRINVSSQSGQGSTFRLIFPRLSQD